MPDIPSENPLQQKPTGDNKSEQTRHDNPNSPSADFSALIDAIKNEGVAYRKEEQREDRGKKFREWITIGLLCATVVAIGWQVYEMIHVYGPIHDQAVSAASQAAASDKAANATVRAADAATKQSENSDKALIQAQRAWVGPQNANFAAELAIGKPIEIAVSYQNSGHEPAIGFIYSVEPFLIPFGPDGDKFAGEKIIKYMNDCKALKEWSGGSVIYPTNSSFGGGYNMTAKTKDDFVDDAVMKGDKIIIVQGCFAYRTFATPHHSYFCYFYRQGSTKIANLNICTAGHDAD